MTEEMNKNEVLDNKKLEDVNGGHEDLSEDPTKKNWHPLEFEKKQGFKYDINQYK